MNLSISKVVALGAAACVGVLPALHGVRTENLVHQGFDQFVKGKFENVGLTFDGRIFPSPGLEEFATLSSPIVWQVREMPDGSLVAATGNNGTLYRVDSEGKESVLFQPEEPLSRALHVDAEGRIYVGTSPKGRVYRILADGTQEVFFDPEDLYIWDIREGPDGFLYIATGGKAKVYRLPADYRYGDKTQTVFEGSESHVNVIAFDRDGQMVIGTGPGGTLYRVDAEGKSYALFSSGAEEIRLLHPTDDGSIVFGTFSTKNTPSGDAAATAQKAPGTEGDGGEINPFQMTVYAGAPAELNGLFRLTVGGFVEPVWVLSPHKVFSAVPLDGDRWLIGTGTDGRLFRSEGGVEWSNLLAVPAGGEITQLLPMTRVDATVSADAAPDSAAGSDGVSDNAAGDVVTSNTAAGFYVVSSNPGRIYKMAGAVAESCVYTSEVMDAGRTVAWGSLRHLSGMGLFDNHLKVSTRSGNVSDPNRSWSEWLPLEQGRIVSPNSRFLQYKVEIEAAHPGIQRIQAYYQEQNLAPEVGDIRILPGAYRLFAQPRPAQNINLSSVIRGGSDAALSAGAQRIPQLVPEKEEGAVTAVWMASDSNGDRLLFDLDIRKIGDPSWIRVVSEIPEPVFAMDIRGLDEGYYQVRIRADDRLDNLPERAASFDKESDPFLIDFTSPQVELESLTTEGGIAIAKVVVTDQFGVISNAYYSVNGDQVLRSLPDDGLFDQTSETFTVVFDLIPGRDNSLVFQAYDENDNVGLVTRSIPGGE